MGDRSSVAVSSVDKKEVSKQLDCYRSRRYGHPGEERKIKMVEIFAGINIAHFVVYPPVHSNFYRTVEDLKN